ncbi:MAG: c-type cytochrome [Bacteroidota bacterium]
MKINPSAILSALIVILFVSSCAQPEKAQHPKIQKLKLQPGFAGEHLFSPSDHDMGSWVSMAFDDKGRLIASDQYGYLYRLEIPPIGSDSLTPKIEQLTVQASDSVIRMGNAQGLLYAFNSLYVMVNHRANDEFPFGSGLYRLQDLDGNDEFDTMTILKELKGSGEHGPHSIILSPDGESLYVIAGNHTDAPEMDAYTLPSNWHHDNLFPHLTDPRGHARDRKEPGGWIAKIDPEGKNWEMISAGYRNPYDIAFNQYGDLFTYDADMEWDLGMPWYRPTRICHATSGSEFGWRTGNAKWSPAYPDNLPPVLNIGQGSPTGVLHGKDSKFPASYQDVLFAFDWSFGIIYGVHLIPDGSSYTGKREEFISGIPLPLTDGVFGPDGALYFMTGGRRLDSDLYRIYYDGEDNSEFVLAPETEAHKVRVQLEQYHGDPQDGAIDFAWPYLGSEDRFVQYAARIAVEHQPVDQWASLVIAEKDPIKLIQGSLALAHQGGQSYRDNILKSLVSIDFDNLTIDQKVNLVRTIEVTLARYGIPSKALKDQVIAYLDPQYPAQNDILNFTSSKVLAYLEAPGVIDKTLTLLETDVNEDATGMTAGATEASDLIMRNLQYGMAIAKTLASMPPAQHTFYGIVLSEVETGWTPELRERYFNWYKKALGYEAGHSYIGFINNSRKTALTHVPADKFDYYNELSGASLLTESGNDIAQTIRPQGPGKRWDNEDIPAVLTGGLSERNFQNGKNMFTAANCITCHTMGGQGGASGPDLTQLGTRFSPEDILSSIIEPDKVISDQYASSVLVLKDGSSVVGRIVSSDDQTYQVSQNPFDPDMLREVAADQVVRIEPSDVSMMPPGTINALNEDELKDLLAYLISGGNPQNELYQ